MKSLMLMVLLSLGVSQIAYAQTLFYQPLNKDAKLSQAQWQALWKTSHERGVDRLIVQWTRYGDEHFDGWLIQSLQAAQDQGLQLILGLHQDSDYFQQLNSPDQLPFYWHQMQARVLKQHQRLQASGLNVSGWYLPAELSDRTFADPARQNEIRAQIKSMAAQLALPLHVSAYSHGLLSPDANAQWLLSLQQAGLVVWWQDGAGLRELPETVRKAYAAALPCEIGIVSEAFKQVSAEGEPFRAVSIAPKRYKSCHPSAQFSLRYMPWAQVLAQ